MRSILPRPKKKRNCEGKPCGKVFKPTCTPLSELKRIRLHQDELEAFRLCDYQGFIQEQAGKKMGVSRGTVQRLLTSARKKVAEALTQGAALVMDEEEKE